MVVGPQAEIALINVNVEMYVFAFVHVDGQFFNDCTNLEPCDISKFLACTNNKCLCISTYYHKDQVCYPSKWCTDCLYGFNYQYILNFM